MTGEGGGVRELVGGKAGGLVGGLSCGGGVWWGQRSAAGSWVLAGALQGRGARVDDCEQGMSS